MINDMEGSTNQRRQTLCCQQTIKKQGKPYTMVPTFAPH